MGYNDKIIAPGYITAHPYEKSHSVVSLVPIARRGKWKDSTLEITFENLVSDVVPDTISEEDMIKELLGQDKTEWWKCLIIERQD